jgi:hypothetical protein
MSGFAQFHELINLEFVKGIPTDCRSSPIAIDFSADRVFGGRWTRAKRDNHARKSRVHDVDFSRKSTLG